jgi:hypothetical protein
MQCPTRACWRWRGTALMFVVMAIGNSSSAPGHPGYFPEGVALREFLRLTFTPTCWHGDAILSACSVKSAWFNHAHLAWHACSQKQCTDPQCCHICSKHIIFGVGVSWIGHTHVFFPPRTVIQYIWSPRTAASFFALAALSFELSHTHTHTHTHTHMPSHSGPQPALASKPRWCALERPFHAWAQCEILTCQPHLRQVLLTLMPSPLF